MNIDGHNYKIIVLILCMESEENVTISAIETLLEGIEEDVTISILLNGGTSGLLKGLLSDVKCVNYYESEKNLGVAGGRNFLLRTPECQSSDIVMILDNDVIPSLDYVRNLAAFLLRKDNAGVVGSVVADINYAPYELISHHGDKGKFGNKIFKIKSCEIKEYLLPQLRPEHLFHIGIHSDYCFRYFSIRSKIYTWLSIFLSLIKRGRYFSPVLKWNTKYLNLIKNGEESYDVSNIPGCSQAFKKKVLDEIGYLNEMFNPYGFEDVDFCTRAVQAGYVNYIDTNTWLFHGTDRRNHKRDSLKVIENDVRCLVIYASTVFSSHLKAKFAILKLILFNFIAGKPSHALKRLKASYRGYILGVQTLKENI